MGFEVDVHVLPHSLRYWAGCTGSCPLLAERLAAAAQAAAIGPTSSAIACLECFNTENEFPAVHATCLQVIQLTASLPSPQLEGRGGSESAYSSTTSSPRYASSRAVPCACATLCARPEGAQGKDATNAAAQSAIVIAGNCTCNVYATKNACVHTSLLFSLWTSPNPQLPFRVVPPPRTAPLVAAAPPEGPGGLAQLYAISKRAEASLLSSLLVAEKSAAPVTVAVQKAVGVSPPGATGAPSRSFASSAVSPWKAKSDGAADDDESEAEVEHVFGTSSGPAAQKSPPGEKIGHGSVESPNVQNGTPSRTRSSKDKGPAITLREVSLDATPPAARRATRLVPTADHNTRIGGAAAISGVVRKRSEFDFDAVDDEDEDDKEVIAVARPNVSTRTAMGILTRPRGGRGTGKRGRGRGSRVTFA